MLYHAYELTHAALSPWRQLAGFGEMYFTHPLSPLSNTDFGRSAGASCGLFNRLTNRFGKPDFGLDQTSINGISVPVSQEIVLDRPFCDLVHFDRDLPPDSQQADPKLLIIAPLSGHFATLLRDTVRAMLPEHDTYVTNWKDARVVPIIEGNFGLDDYIDYVLEFVRELGPDTHVLAVCQPSVPALAAAAIMSAQQDPCTPISLTLMGGPIDTRRAPTAVNEHANAHDIDWFRQRVISHVPFPHAGAFRAVYPGFLQLSGFMSMNMDRHIDAFQQYFNHLVEGDADSARQHRKFYDEYLAVMDLPAEYFLETVERIFQKHQFADNELSHRGQHVDCRAIDNITLMTVEGENDDICAVGQTQAAHDLCPNIPDERRYHYVQPGVGHYGVFNGTRWRTEIQPRIREMIRATETSLKPAKKGAKTESAHPPNKARTAKRN